MLTIKTDKGYLEIQKNNEPVIQRAFGVLGGRASFDRWVITENGKNVVSETFANKIYLDGELLATDNILEKTAELFLNGGDATPTPTPEDIPLASETKDGLMSKEVFTEHKKMSNDVGKLKGKTISINGKTKKVIDNPEFEIEEGIEDVKVVPGFSLLDDAGFGRSEVVRDVSGLLFYITTHYAETIRGIWIFDEVEKKLIQTNINDGQWKVAGKDINGRAYFCNYNKGSDVYVYDTQTELIVPLGVGVIRFDAIDYDVNSGVHYVNKSGISIYDIDTNTITQTAFRWNPPRFIKYVQGTLFFPGGLDGTNMYHLLRRDNVSGNIVGIYHDPSGARPSGIEEGNDGKIYVATQGGGQSSTYHGIWVLNTSNWSLIPTNVITELPNAAWSKIIKGKNGTLYFRGESSSNRGMWVLDENSGNIVRTDLVGRDFEFESIVWDSEHEYAQGETKLWEIIDGNTFNIIDDQKRWANLANGINSIYFGSVGEGIFELFKNSVFGRIKEKWVDLDDYYLRKDSIKDTQLVPIPILQSEYDAMALAGTLENKIYLTYTPKTP